MPGFTAINTRNLEANAPNASAPPEMDVMVAVRRKSTKRRQPARKKPGASKDVDQTALDSTKTRKPISGKGKKRASHPGDEPEPKRRKSGSIESSMPTTKTVVSSTMTMDPGDATETNNPSASSTEAGLVSLTSMTKLNGFRYATRQAARSTEIEPQTTQSTSVYHTPETSMSSFQRSLPRTTMQAVRNSSRGSSLLYWSSATLPTTSQLPPTASLPSGATQVLPSTPHGVGFSRSPVGSTSTLGLKSGSDVVLGHSRATRSSLASTSTLGLGSNDNVAPKPPRRQLPAPVISDVPRGNGERNSRPSISRLPSTDYRDFEDLVDLDDDEPIEQAKRESTTYGSFEDSLDLDDDEMIELSKRVESTAQPGKSPPSRARKLDIRDTHEHDDYGGALLSEEERKLLDAIKIPQDARRPIVRTAFPLPIIDRTSLFGVSNTSALRTCFRVGEAMNAGCQAVRNNRSLVLELYARVTSSWREPKPSRKQHFIINDLYHDKPPFINGTFELWDQSSLWEQDSRPFLTAGVRGILCRMIARMKRDGTKWRLEILNIWQADWEDVEHVASIYAKPTTDDDDDGGL